MTADADVKAPTRQVADLIDGLRTTTQLDVWREAVASYAADPTAWLAYARREVRVALLASHTANAFDQALVVAGLSVGVAIEVLQAPFAQFEQELLDERSLTSLARPDYVLLSPTQEDADLGAPDAVVTRWTRLWEAARARGARPVQHLFVLPWDDPHGVVAAAHPGSVSRVLAAVNAELFERAAEADAIAIDCDRLASEFGRRRWRDPRYWVSVRQAVAVDAVPRLAQATAGAIAADLGLTRRCLVLDLDNTLWGGIVGEDGLAGLRLGDGPSGEAYTAFQRYLAALSRLGMVLAIASKNDAPLVEEALAGLPQQILRRNDFAAVVVDWRPKSEQVREVALRLSLGLESLCFVDDNPAERLQVRHALPEVDVVELPPHPSDYVAALAARPTLQLGRLTDDDRLRAASYTATGAAVSARQEGWTLAEFLADLRMSSRTRPVEARTLPRAAQLVQKTNQFNLTARRRSPAELEALASSPDWFCVTLDLTDRLADHGIVGLALARFEGDAAVIDTLLLSCRVIGRTAEKRLLAVVADEAARRGCANLLGEFVPTGRNELVRGLYASLGFAPAPDDGATLRYTLAHPAASMFWTPHISEADGVA